MNRLRKIYKKFLFYSKKRFLKDSGEWLGVEKTRREIKEKFYENYYRISFFQFLSNVKSLVYSSCPFDFISNGWGDDWDMEVCASFLKKEKLTSFKKDEIKIRDKDFFNFIPAIKTEKEIKITIEKKLRVKVDENQAVTSLIDNFVKFQIKAKWDQMPLSQSSAVFCVKKIIEYAPIKGKFLFIGDDDFLSVFLGLTGDGIIPVVIDADEELLQAIESIAKKFNFQVETHLVDTRKPKKIKENFIGFLCNPPYTEKGVENFINFGINHLGKDGGNAFLAVSSENIGNRMVFLQKFFAKKNLLSKELITGKLNYPYLDLHGEDEINFKRMKKHFSEKIIKKSPRLAADLWIFDYIPFKIEKVEPSNSIYSYL